MAVLADPITLQPQQLQMRWNETRWDEPLQLQLRFHSPYSRVDIEFKARHKYIDSNAHACIIILCRITIYKYKLPSITVSGLSILIALLLWQLGKIMRWGWIMAARTELTPTPKMNWLHSKCPNHVPRNRQPKKILTRGNTKMPANNGTQQQHQAATTT